MAVMSFAYLKKEIPNKTDDGNTSRAAFLHDTLISNLHDFPKAAGVVDVNSSRNDLQGRGDVFRTCYAIPAIMPTARIASVNLCRGCPRFIQESEAAENNLKKSKAGYGFCLRDSDRGGEEYIAIPAKATVDRCYINMMWDKWFSTRLGLSGCKAASICYNVLAGMRSPALPHRTFLPRNAAPLSG